MLNTNNISKTPRTEHCGNQEFGALTPPSGKAKKTIKRSIAIEKLYISKRELLTSHKYSHRLIPPVVRRKKKHTINIEARLCIVICRAYMWTETPGTTIRNVVLSSSASLNHLYLLYQQARYSEKRNDSYLKFVRIEKSETFARRCQVVRRSVYRVATPFVIIA